MKITTVTDIFTYRRLEPQTPQPFTYKYVGYCCNLHRLLFGYCSVTARLLSVTVVKLGFSAQADVSTQVASATACSGVSGTSTVCARGWRSLAPSPRQGARDLPRQVSSGFQPYPNTFHKRCGRAGPEFLTMPQVRSVLERGTRFCSLSLFLELGFAARQHTTAQGEASRRAVAAAKGRRGAMLR